MAITSRTESAQPTKLKLDIGEFVRWVFIRTGNPECLKEFAWRFAVARTTVPDCKRCRRELARRRFQKIGSLSRVCAVMYGETDTITSKRPRSGNDSFRLCSIDPSRCCHHEISPGRCIAWLEEKSECKSLRVTPINPQQRQHSAISRSETKFVLPSWE